MVVKLKLGWNKLEKQLDKLGAELRRSAGKLANANFVNNAPADVVTQERQRKTEFERKIARLDEQLANLADLG